MQGVVGGEKEKRKLINKKAAGTSSSVQSFEKLKQAK